MHLWIALLRLFGFSQPKPLSGLVLGVGSLDSYPDLIRIIHLLGGETGSSSVLQFRHGRGGSQSNEWMIDLVAGARGVIFSLSVPILNHYLSATHRRRFRAALIAAAPSMRRAMEGLPAKDDYAMVTSGYSSPPAMQAAPQSDPSLPGKFQPGLLSPEDFKPSADDPPDDN